MKTKFYPLRTLLFTLLLSFGFAETINAQTIHLDVTNSTTGGDGSRASLGDKLRVTITVNGPLTVSDDPKVFCPIFGGTSYVPKSTTLNRVSIPDQSGAMPWVTAQPITPPAQSTDEVEIRFFVTVTATAGVINGNAELQTVNLSIPPSTTTTTVLLSGDCSNQFYSLTTMYSPGYLPPAPTLYWPYQFIREVNFNTGGAVNLVYDGKNSSGYEYVTFPNPAYNSLPANTVLTDATAMAMQTGSSRLYFVNKPINGIPADLCYYGTNPAVNGGNATAIRLTNQPLTQNTTSLITRMTMDTQGQGYAITDNGGEFIRFTADATSVTVTKRGALVDDVNNGVNQISLETGGDIVCDGAGNLILITFAGKVYKINNAANDNVATWLTNIPNFPSTGCQSVAIGPDGTFIIGGRSLNVYKYTLSSNTFTQLTTGGFASIDFASCTMPPQTARVAVNEPTTPLSTVVSARVLPNPFKKDLTLQVQLATAENVKIRLVDFYGRTVYTTTRQMGAGTNSLHLPVPGNLSEGIYVVDIWAGNNHLLQKKLVKQ